jgi:hypothetical protein
VGSREKVDRDGASPLGVGSGGGVEGNREERALAGVSALGFSSSSSPIGYDKKINLAKIF